MLAVALLAPAARADDTAVDIEIALDTAQVLAGLRTNEITLNLILQASSAQTALRCYQSLASAAYGNGTATQSGEPGGCGGECPPCGGPPPGPPVPEATARPCPVSGASPEDSAS